MNKVVFFRSFPVLVAGALFWGCGSENPGAAGSDLVNVGDEIGVGDDVDSDVVGLDFAAETDESLTTTLDIQSEKPLQCGVVIEACTEGKTVLLADEVDSITVVTSAMSGDGGLVAWSNGVTLRARLVGADGTPPGETIVIHDGEIPVSNVEVLVGPDGYIVLFSRGTVDGVTSPDEILDYAARVTKDGVLVMPARVLTTGVQLMRGAAISETGLRMWGIRDAPSQDTGDVFRQASMIRATVDGVFQETHYMLNASKFEYMRMHASGNQLNVPFVDPSPNQAVSYLLQNVNLPGCGVPVLPVVELGESKTMVATAFLSPLVALWAARDEPSDADPQGILFVHNTAFSTTESLPLPWAPSTLADLSAHDQGVALLVDFDGSDMVAAGIDPYLPCVGNHYTVDVLPNGKTPVVMRMTPSGGGFFVVWAVTDGSRSQVWGRQHCPIR